MNSRRRNRGGDPQAGPSASHPAPAPRGLSSLATPPDGLSAKRKRLAPVVILSVAAHLLILMVLFPARTDPPMAQSEPMAVSLVAPTPQAPPSPPAPAQAPAAKPPPPRNIVRPTPRRPDRPPLAADVEPTAVVEPGLSEGQLVGAATAGSGAGGGGCDMVRALQAALRKDPLVRAAVADPQRAGKAFMVWDGDWVRHSGQEGRGLAAVREAILWEVGFAPAACRAQTVHGLVLISLSDAPGAVRLAVGAGQWRWSDLLTPRRSFSSDETVRE
jgi:hypothetical protein